MSWVTIDKDNCTECGICLTRCRLCFSDQDGVISAQADENCCNLCGHCVSLCPTGAIVHHEMDMDNFLDLGGKVNFETDDFVRFVRQRRSHRHFKDRPLLRRDLEILIEVCRCSPTGSNRQTVNIIIVQDRGRINRYSNHVVDSFEKNMPLLEKHIKERETEGLADDPATLSAMGRLNTLNRVATARRHGLEVIFHRAPAVMIFHSPELSSTPKDDCVIAAQTVVLTAMTMGLETCYIGLFEFAANTYPPLVEELGLPAGHKVYSTLILGYPELEFLRTVDRRPINTKWQ